MEKAENEYDTCYDSESTCESGIGIENVNTNMFIHLSRWFSKSVAYVVRKLGNGRSELFEHLLPLRICHGGTQKKQKDNLKQFGY